MARIQGVDVPRDKRIEISLTYVKGIGRSSARRILDTIGVDRDTRARDLSDSDYNKINDQIRDEGINCQGDLDRLVSQNIKRKMEIGTYQGLRHRRNLPVRGQRTQTNARTRKGPKKTVAGKKKVIK